ncbi:MAG TPA: small multi-drug export protein [Candidatus Thermoplasmatota archaeon]|nr:small multi-drug export protein [Candidatus Thermoplasmatota archaeon]
MVADGLREALETILPDWLVVTLLAFMPIVEVRASIPVGYLVYRMGAVQTVLWSLLGCLLILPVAFAILPVLERLGRKWSRLGTMMDWLFARARKQSKKAQVAGHAGLFAIVALPLPGAGTWTACIAAYVLGMPVRKALPTILLGILVEIAIVGVVVFTGAKAWEWLLSA